MEDHLTFLFNRNVLLLLFILLYAGCAMWAAETYIMYECLGFILCRMSLLLLSTEFPWIQ